MKNRGITLLSLVVTIVVLLILSGITINILLNSGVINIAQETKEEQRKSEILEQLQIVEQDIVTKNLGNITIEEYLEQVYAKKIVVPEKTEQVDEKSYNVTSEDGYTFHIKEERKNVIKINYIEEIDKTPEKPIEKFSINEEFKYTGSEQKVTLKPGTYVIKCYGAEGGYGKYNDTYKYEPGKGAYTKGILTLTETTTLYLYVGGKGGDSPKGNGAVGGTGGYNGGGTGGRDSSDNDSGGGGGGATDIRLIGGEWNNADGLRSRIMVAAGGSGSSYVTEGLDGGELEGNTYDTKNNTTQTLGNAFGIGGNGTDYTSVAGSGAGGGYYGGIGGEQGGTSNKKTVGESGSSYISGYTGCNSVKSQTDGTHSGSSTHYSNLKFDKAVMISGYNEGNGKITIEGGTEYIPAESTWIDNTYNYTGEEQKVLLEPGTYEIECYGAEGGHGKYDDTYKYEPGKGAYTRGVLTLTKTTTLYLYVGGKGGDSPKGNKAAGGTGGYNGGGTGGRDSSDNDSGGGGGGATDIRLIGGEWNNADGLRSRIMVAAGGSGSGYVAAGQDGGTLEGNSYDTSKKATQTSGNAFGIGGNGTDNTYVAGSGGGGGYYGGFGDTCSSSTTDKKTVGGSGSSYISGYNGCNSVKSQTSSTHSGSSTHYSNLIFKNAIMTAGTNAGDGKIVIKGGKDYIPSVKNEPTIISYTGGTQQITLNPGTYEIECYGAEGGYGKNDDTYIYEPGKGAVTKGELTLTKTTTLYLYVGGKGGDSPKGNGAAGGTGGYNGGGTGGRDSSDNDSGGGGGGATDIRLIGGEWNNASGLRSRIMVAAGGSGSSYAAAGLNGGSLEGNTNDTSKKATQTSGNAFGIGGNGTNSTFIGGSGAGGGYYGGFGGASTSSITDNKTVGGSGSSYISGYTGCNSVKSQTSSTHSGSSTHYSNLIFKNATMTAGTNSGNGKIVIRNK